MPEKLPLYLDSHATTPVDPRVLDVMLPYFTEVFGNAASIDHEAGALAQRAVEQARIHVATALNATPQEIIFTSGSTEANNLAILGASKALVDRGRHIITCATEHPAVLDPYRYCESIGWEATYLKVDSGGLVDPDDVHRAIRPDTVLISVMAANNEVGTIAPIAEIGRVAKEREVLFHTDATQALGKLPIDVQAMGIDLLSLSAHKIYGPKGVGALYVRRRSPRVKLTPQLHGGGHERGFRSGTLNVPGIVGLGAAVRLVTSEMATEPARLIQLRDRLWRLIKEAVPDADLNGHPTLRLPQNLNVAIPRIDAKALLIELKQILCISAGSACATTKVEPSHVLRALGHPDERAFRSIRIGLGRFTSESDVEFAATQLATAIRKLHHLRS